MQEHAYFQNANVFTP